MAATPKPYAEEWLQVRFLIEPALHREFLYTAHSPTQPAWSHIDIYSLLTLPLVRADDWRPI
jgi:hypothetical protein